MCLADRPAGRQWRGAACGSAAEEEMPETDSRAAGHQTAPGGAAEPQPRPGEETAQVSQNRYWIIIPLSRALQEDILLVICPFLSWRDV